MRAPLRRSSARVVLAGLLALTACDASQQAAPPAAPAARGAPAAEPAAPQGSYSIDARHELVARMRAELDEPRHASDGGGRAWRVEPDEATPVAAASLQRLHLVYEVGPLGVARGGTVWLLLSPFWGWDPPQVEDPQRRGYVAVHADTPALRLEAEVPVPGRMQVAVRAAERALEPGERIHILYGAGPALARVDTFAEHRAPLRVAVDGDGDGFHHEIAASPTLDIEADRPAQLQLTLPGSARPGEPVRLVVALLDRNANAGTHFVGRVELRDVSAGLALPREIVFEPGQHGQRVVEGVVTTPGVHRIRGVALSPEGRELPGGAAESNPMRVGAREPRLLWGDLHGHSNFSDGTGTPRDYFLYARDVAGLDVAALTDHDHWGARVLDRDPALWHETRDTVRELHAPGRFVPLLGYEWTNWLHGHRHVLYFADEGEVLSALDPRYENPRQLWDALRGRAALTFAHHSAGGPMSTNWDYLPDATLEPVTEIVSRHGSSEAADSPLRIEPSHAGNFVRDVLDRGPRLGFIGSGDGHDGHPGFTHLTTHSGGLAGIYAEALTRDAVLGALRARRVYATSGVRILLRVELDGLPMGSDLAAGSAEHALDVSVVGTAPIARVEIIRRGARAPEVLEAGGRREWSVRRSVPALAPGDYLYVRALQEDGHVAWSSPFFAGPPAPAR